MPPAPSCRPLFPPLAFWARGILASDSRTAIGALIVVTAVLFTTTSAQAFNLGLTGTTPSSTSRTLLVAHPDLIDGFFGGAEFHFANAPLLCRQGFETSAVVSATFTPAATVGYGLLDGRLQLSARLPLTIAQLSTSTTDPLCPHTHTAFGPQVAPSDPALSATYVIFPSRDAGLSLATRVELGVPLTGPYGNFIEPAKAWTPFFGDAFGALSASINPGAQYEAFAVAGELGVTLRAPETLLGYQLGSNVFAKVGAAVHLITRGLYFTLDVTSRAYARLDVVPFLSSSAPSLQVEPLVGVRFEYLGFYVAVGAGSAFLPGPGSSSGRVLLSVGFNQNRMAPPSDPWINVQELTNDVYVAVQDVVTPEPKRKKRRRRIKEKPLPCPDAETAKSLTADERVYYSPECFADGQPLEKDPFPEKSFEEVMCAEVVAAVCEGAGKLPPIVDRAAHFEFALGSAELTAAHVARLERIANFTLPERRLQSVVVVGHADALGSDALNDELALKRAQAVADALVAAGLDPVMLQVMARGEKDPLVDIFDEVAGAPSNRRVDVTLRYEVIESEAPPAPPPPPPKAEEAPRRVPITADSEGDAATDDAATDATATDDATTENAAADDAAAADAATENATDAQVQEEHP